MIGRAAPYEIVTYRPELKPEIATLQQHLWRAGETGNRAYLEWKYERNPYLPAPLVYLARHEGRVVGMRGMFGSCWEADPGSGPVVVPCADDLVVEPAHRNRGVVGQIMRAALADLEARGHTVAFSLSAGAATLTSSLADGWRPVGSVREVSRISRPGSWRWRLGTRMRDWRAVWRWAEMIAHGWRRPFHHLDRPGDRESADRAIRVTRAPRPDAMADLVRRLGHDGRARHVRDAQYLAWRFQDPQHEYRFLWAGEDRLEGYMVLCASRRAARRGVAIVDWEGSDHSAREALLRSAIERGRFAELSAWTLGLPPDVRALLREAGFVPATRHRLVREGPLVLVRPLGAGRPAPWLASRALLEPASWDLRMLYSMAG